MSVSRPKQQELNEQLALLDKLNAEEQAFKTTFVASYFIPVRNRILQWNDGLIDKKIEAVKKILELGRLVIAFLELDDKDTSKRLSDNLIKIFRKDSNHGVLSDEFIQWCSEIKKEFDQEFQIQQDLANEIFDDSSIINREEFLSEEEIKSEYDKELKYFIDRITYLNLTVDRRNLVNKQINKILSSQSESIYKKAELLFLFNLAELMEKFTIIPEHKEIADNLFEDFSDLVNKRQNLYEDENSDSEDYLTTDILALTQHYAQTYKTQLDAADYYRESDVSLGEQKSALDEEDESKIDEASIEHEFLVKENKNAIELLQRNFKRYLLEKSIFIPMGKESEVDYTNIFNASTPKGNLSTLLQDTIMRYFTGQGAITNLLSTVIYLDLFLTNNNIQLHQFNMERLVFIAAAMAHRFHDDESYIEKDLVFLSELSKKDYNKLFTQFYCGLDMQANISSELFKQYKALAEFSGNGDDFKVLKQELTAAILKELLTRKAVDTKNEIYKAEKVFQHAREDSDSLKNSYANITIQLDDWRTKVDATKDLQEQIKLHEEMVKTIEDLKTFHKLAQETLVTLASFDMQDSQAKKVADEIIEVVQKGYDTIATKATLPQIKQAYQHLDAVLEESIKKLDGAVSPTLFGSSKAVDIKNKIKELLEQNKEFKDSILSVSVSSGPGVSH